MKFYARLPMLLFFSWVVLALVPCRAKEVRFTITNGKLIYSDELGKEATIDVGKRCTDLWVSPDNSMIAFVSIDMVREGGVLLPGEQPVIERSSIYLARKTEKYSPVLVISREFAIGGRSWSVVRDPSVAPDGETVFFEIPYAMTTWKLMRYSLPSRSYETIGDANSYCVIWNGQYSGSLVVQARHEPPPERALEGVSYRFYLRDRAGSVIDIGHENDTFRDFANRWSQEHGGTCPVSTGLTDQVR